MKALTPAQVRSYHHDGYLFPVEGLRADEVRHYLAAVSDIEAHAGAPLPVGDKRWRSAAYLYSRRFYELACHPRILDAVEDVIGPDILAYMATFFIKEPGGPAFTAWHQDSTYFGLDPHEHVTAWIALTDASEQAGCMEVLSARGAARQLHHENAYLPHSINGAGQVIVEPLDDSGAVAMQLAAGQFSLHNTLCCHRSAPNRAAHRRIGWGVSYIPARVRTTGSHRMYGLLVRGRNEPGNFDLLPAPKGEFEPEAMAVHERFFLRWRENYVEQERMHAAHFAEAAPAQT
jgi:hypothetical protein